MALKITFGDDATQVCDAKHGKPADDVVKVVQKVTVSLGVEDTTAVQIVPVESISALPKTTELSMKTKTDQHARIHTTATATITNRNSPLALLVKKPFDCKVRVKRSCRESIATTKGTLPFWIVVGTGKKISATLELLVVPNLGATLFSVGALRD